MRVDRGKSGLTWFVVISVLMTMVKFQAVFACVACCLYFLLRWARTGAGARGRSLRVLGWIVAGTGLAAAGQFGWQWLRMCLSLPDPPGSDYVLDAPAAFSASTAFQQSTAFLYNLYAGPLNVMKAQTAISAHVTLAFVLVISALVAAAVLPVPVSGKDRALAQSALVSLLVLGPLFYTYIAVTTDTAFSLPPRYGAALLPFMFVGLPLCVRGRGRERGVLVFALLVASCAYVLNASG